MVPATLLTTLLLALAAAADPIVVRRSPVTLPISKRVNSTTIRNLLLHDQARAKALRAKGEAKAAGIPFHTDAVINSPADNQAVSYIASVGVGSPATTCKSWQQSATIRNPLTGASPQIALSLTLEGKRRVA